MRTKIALSGMALLWLGACGDGGTGNDTAEILVPEPANAPSDPADGRLSCLGKNTPTPAGSNQIVLLGWTRFLSDPTTETNKKTPGAKVEAFSAKGVSLGQSFANTTDGRVAVTVPIAPSGFTGYLEATEPMLTLVPYQLWSSRPYTDTRTAGWAWMATKAELTALAQPAGVTLDDNKGIVAVAVHDCDNFGVANAVVQVAGSVNGAIFFDGFNVAAGRTFTAASGRAAFPNVAPGTVTVKAFGRIKAGGPLVLLSVVDVTVKAGAVIGVDLQPRVGLLK